jgi:hypothetical protein
MHTLTADPSLMALVRVQKVAGYNIHKASCFVHTFLACRHLLTPVQPPLFKRSVCASSSLETSRHAQSKATGHLGKCLLFILGVATAVLLQAAPAEAETRGSMRGVAGESAQSLKELPFGAHLQPYKLNMFTTVSVTVCLRV